MSIARTTACALLLGLAAPLQATGCSAADNPASRTAQRVLQALVEVNGVPGMGAAVWREDGVVWIGSAGQRDREAGLPVEADTIFRLASVSKVFATTAIARLAEQGRLNLDEPVSTYLPWLGSRWAPISLRQLAAHASGLGHYIDADNALGHRHFDTARAAVRWFFERPLGSAPGERYLYSSWGYTLIGAVIEAVAGTSYIDHVQGELTPGLDVAQDSSGRGAHVSRLYDIEAGEVVLLPGRDLSYTVPGGGMTASPAAVAEFAGRLMDGHIVSGQSWEAMRRPFALIDGSIAGERDYQVGLGWRTGRDEEGAAIAHHAGVTEGARSALVLWPDERTAAVLLSNALWVSSIEASAMLLAAPFRAAPAGLVERECPLQAQGYRGTLGEANIEGELRFELEQGRCVGVLEPDSTLAAAFGNARAWPGRRLQIVSLSDNGSLSRAALVTPYGLYELRAAQEGWRARLPAGELTLRTTAGT
jgi:CubicO group peptidase (beta-lactamase class C family)